MVADEQMLRALCAEHAGALLGYATRLTGGDRGRAEDIVQETLLRAWRHPQALDPARGSLRPWLLTVARRIAIDEHRARRARPYEVELEPRDLGVAPDRLDEALAGWLVEDALSTLSPEHRAVLTETYLRGRSVDEAARALGIPSGTVKSRCYYALRALRLALQEREMTS
ncbi:MAG TPA: sigma-70 family RNA polymerase sigma factor [Acidimicrobiales bacterium]|nr:sigma-70 family RNA polymerase sigma factor [Acidimicrobiales bacterium]